MFPTCPACKQSVLEDDAENCPFCGANMKTGKGGKGLAPKAPAKSSVMESPQAASAPAPSPTAKSASAKLSSKSSDGDDGDPFGVDAAANSRAIALAPRPAKGKTVRFVCPMCETPGFASSEVAGKEVKCCNEACPLPIFTAPKAAAAVAGSDPRTPATPMPTVSAPVGKKASPMLVLSAVGALVLAGGSLWFFVFNEPALIKPPPPPPRSTAGNDTQPVVPNPDPNLLKVDEPKPAEKAKPRGAELRAAILPIIVDLSRQSEKNRSKPFCRRLAAEAYIEAGDIKSARENIDQLLKIGQNLGFHQVPPLTQIAWRELAAGNTDAAKAAADEAWKAAPDLPATSRLTFDAVTDLAALLIVVGRTDDAVSLMKKENMLPSGSSGTLSILTRRARLLRSFDMDEAASTLPVIAWKSPQWVMSTVTLVLRGYADKGRECIALAPDAEIKADCWAAWGDSIVAAPNSDAATNDEPITAALRNESPATQARVWARVASARQLAKQSDAATRAATNAASALKSIPLPKDFVLPDIKQMQKLELLDPVVPRLNALAAAETSRAQALLRQDGPAAESLAMSLQHLRGHAPSLPSAGRLFDATSRDPNGVKAQLKKALDLKTDDKVNQAFTTYRAKCKSAYDAATARFALQAEILKAAVDWPLVDAVWTEASARSGNSTAEESREDLLKSNLSVRLGQRLRAAGKTDAARQCDNAVTTGELSDARDTLQRETAEAIHSKESGAVSTVAQQLAAYQAKPADGERFVTEDTDWPLLWGLRLTCRLLKEGQRDKAFDLITGFKDMLWREEGFEMLAALIAKDPAAAEPIWKKYRPSLLSPTEKIAIFRGLCAGLSASLTTPSTK